MRDHALADHRPFLLVALAAAVSYWFVADDGIAGLTLIVWKGIAVGALAAYALRRAGHIGGKGIAAFLALCAIGDMAIELSYLAGGTAFALAHAVGIAFFLKHRRGSLSSSQTLFAVTLLIGTPLIAALLTYPEPNWWLATGYALLLAGLAASAWTSRFPRYRVGIGAVLFLVSDLVLLGSVAGRLPEGAGEWLVWPLYFIGQFLIATGVVQTLRKP